mmetsp:Transcript_20821/g.41654  ORF Transcript_20821/g.41654 Transcript_20821/m.41654 type:complete len:219 (+) Transcript_20821:1024-1680(+)
MTTARTGPPMGTGGGGTRTTRTRGGFRTCDPKSGRWSSSIPRTDRATSSTDLRRTTCSPYGWRRCFPIPMTRRMRNNPRGITAGSSSVPTSRCTSRRIPAPPTRHTTTSTRTTSSSCRIRNRPCGSTRPPGPCAPTMASRWPKRWGSWRNGGCTGSGETGSNATATSGPGRRHTPVPSCGCTPRRRSEMSSPMPGTWCPIFYPPFLCCRRSTRRTRFS